MTLTEKERQLRQDFDEVYETGYKKGKSEADTTDAYNEGFNAGKQAEYDAFWDAYQDNGNRTDYVFGFHLWNSDILKPKYDIKPQNGCDSIFRAVTGITDFEQWQKDCDIVVDFSNATRINDGFFGSSFEVFGILNFSKISSMNFCFANAKAKTIEKIILPTNKATTFNSTFGFANQLEEIRFEGLISSNGLNLQWSTNLSRASLESIMTHLDMNTNVDGRFLTLSKAAVDKAFEETEGANDGSNSYDWINLTANAYNLGGWETVLV